MATVDQIQSNAYLVSAAALAELQRFLNNLYVEVTNGIIPTLPDPVSVLLDKNTLATALADLRAGQPRAPFLINYGALVPPPVPGVATFTVPTLVNLPEFTLVEPTINIPAAPHIDMPAAPGEAPAINAPAIPNKPVFSLPPTPAFYPVKIPIAPTVNFPAYVNEMPVDDIVLPSTKFEYAEAAYESALLDEVTAKLMYDLVNGGYGIETADELLIWERARERELKEAGAAIEEASRQAAARGFMLPPGALFAQIQAAQENATLKNSSFSREIAIKRADMFVENRKFTIEKSLELEKMMMDFFSATAERALNAAKAGVEMGIALFNASVARYNARLMLYKTNAEIYEIQIKAALATVEVFKTEVEAAKVEADIQQVLANVYRIQVDGVKTLIDMYAVEMQAAQTQAEIENIKLQAFRTSVEAYTAQVGARTAEFQMYESQIRGETAKIESFRAGIDAYNARLTAHRSRTETESAVATVQIAQQEAHLKRYQAQLDGYRADIAKLSSQSQEMISLYGSQTQQYAAVSGATAKFYDLDVAVQNANATIYLEHSKQAIEKTWRELQAVLKNTDQRIAGSSQASVVLGQLASTTAHAVQGIAALTTTSSV